MKILDMKINWNEGLLNNPQLVVIAKDLPEYKDLRFEMVDGLYVAEQDGYVSYIYKANLKVSDCGFSGEYHELIMKDGTVVSWHGGWSSRAEIVNQLFPHLLIMDVLYQEKGGGCFLGAIALRRVMSEYRKFFNENKIGIRRILNHDTGLRYYIPYYKDAKEYTNEST